MGERCEYCGYKDGDWIVHRLECKGQLKELLRRFVRLIDGMERDEEGLRSSDVMREVRSALQSGADGEEA